MAVADTALWRSPVRVARSCGAVTRTWVRARAPSAPRCCSRRRRPCPCREWGAGRCEWRGVARQCHRCRFTVGWSWVGAWLGCVRVFIFLGAEGGGPRRASDDRPADGHSLGHNGMRCGGEGNPPPSHDLLVCSVVSTGWRRAACVFAPRERGHRPPFPTCPTAGRALPTLLPPQPPSPTPCPSFAAASGDAPLARPGGCGAHLHARKRGERQPQVQQLPWLICRDRDCGSDCRPPRAGKRTGLHTRHVWRPRTRPSTFPADVPSGHAAHLLTVRSFAPGFLLCSSIPSFSFSWGTPHPRSPC